MCIAAVQYCCTSPRLSQLPAKACLPCLHGASADTCCIIYTTSTVRPPARRINLTVPLCKRKTCLRHNARVKVYDQGESRVELTIVNFERGGKTHVNCYVTNTHLQNSTASVPAEIHKQNLIGAIDTEICSKGILGRFYWIGDRHIWCATKLLFAVWHVYRNR